jgi:hypothetical protein
MVTPLISVPTGTSEKVMSSSPAEAVEARTNAVRTSAFLFMVSPFRFFPHEIGRSVPEDGSDVGVKPCRSVGCFG